MGVPAVASVGAHPRKLTVRSSLVPTTMGLLFVVFRTEPTVPHRAGVIVGKIRWAKTIAPLKR